MKISLVTISYNQKQFLEQAIQSVLKQDYPDIEYIVVDPGSTDGSREIIQRYSDRITKIIYEHDNGPADGLNKGLVTATGELFGFLNSDDVLLPGALSKIAQEFRRKKWADVISGHGFLIDENNDLIKPIFSHHFRLMDYLHGACVLVQQSTFYRRKLLQQIGGFNVSNKINWDGELWANIAASGGRFHRIHSFLSGFRSHSSSITNSLQYERALSDEHDLLCKKFKITKTPLLAKMLWLRNRLSDPLVTGLRVLHEVGIANFKG